MNIFKIYMGLVKWYNNGCLLYTSGFHSLVKDYEKEHNERMKTERPDRRRTVNQMLNKRCV